MNRVENLLEDLRLHRGTLFPIVTRLRAMVSIGIVTGPPIGSQKGPLPLVASGQRA